MTGLVSVYNYWIALGAVLLQCATVYLLIEHFFLKEKYLSPYVARFGTWMVLLVAAVAAVLSLTYSEYFGFVPCGFCWVERGLLYAIVIISATALWREQRGARDAAVADYGMVLAVIGGLVSLYHHSGQMSGRSLGLCPTAGEDCARRLVFEFGYITLPLMAFTTFLFVFAVFLVYRAGTRKNGL